MRKLLVTRRVVPLDRSDEYAVAWRRLAAVCALRSAHAWVFQRLGHEDQLIEFLEWEEGVRLSEDPDVEEALRALEEVAVGASEELEEAEP